VDKPLDNPGVIAFPPLIWRGERGDQRADAFIRTAADYEIQLLSCLRDRLDHFGAYPGAVGLAHNESGRDQRFTRLNLP